MFLKYKKIIDNQEATAYNCVNVNASEDIISLTYRKDGEAMKAILLMFDTLNLRMLAPYGCEWTITPNFSRLAERTITFDNCYAGSLPCMPARRELHTGRYNFLHRSWGPMEPFDDSMPQILSRDGVYTTRALTAYRAQPALHGRRAGARPAPPGMLRGRIHSQM